MSTRERERGKEGKRERGKMGGEGGEGGGDINFTCRNC